MAVLKVNPGANLNTQMQQRLAQALSAVVSDLTQLDPACVQFELDPSESLGTSAADPEQLVRTYLAAMEQRDLARAQTFLAEGFVMSFPGSGELSSLDELVNWARSRYRFVKKQINAVNVCYETDRSLVYVVGTLSGEWPSGHPFQDVRFIDRFEIQNNLFTRQDVWNDLANTAP